MEFRFDNEKRRSYEPETRVYNPAGRGANRVGPDGLPIPVRLRTEDEEQRISVLHSEIRFSDPSKIMILISVFLIALTALISLFGAAEYAQIATDIETINTDIETYQQQISQVRKTQSSMNDYSSITEACLDRGMQMIWEPNVGGSNP